MTFFIPLLAGIERSPVCSRKDVYSRKTAATTASSSSSFELSMDNEISCYLKHITNGKNRHVRTSTKDVKMPGARVESNFTAYIF